MNLLDDIESIREELKLLRKVVESLNKKVEELTQIIESNMIQKVSNTEKTSFGTFNINQTVSRYNFQNYLYSEMLNIISEADISGSGVTAEEFAKIWGRSRSRASEMLNQLVRKGLLVKYQDGRSIKFKAVKKDSQTKGL